MVEEEIERKVNKYYETERLKTTLDVRGEGE